MTQKPYGTVLLKAAKILDYLAEEPEKSLQEIARNTQLTNSTALKILETLLMIGYVQRKKDKTYKLGSTLIRYANQTIDELDLVELSLPYLEELQKKVDETIHLGVLSGNEILYVNKLEPQYQTIRMSSKIGVTRPLYSSAMGKAVLAEFSEEDYARYLQQTTLTAFTPQTITTSDCLEEELTSIRQDKLAFDDEEMEQEVFCIGAAIQKGDDTFGAFSVSLPKYRLSEDLKIALIPQIKETKAQIEAALAKKDSNMKVSEGEIFSDL